MIFGKKQKKQTKRTVSSGRASSSVPITRYYRSQQSTSAVPQMDDLSKSRRASRTNAIHRKHFDITTVLTAFCIAAVLIFAGLLTGSPVVKVVNDESFYRDEQEYTDAIRALVNQSPLKRTKLTAQSSSLENEILSQFPEVENVSVIVPLAGQRLQVGLRLHEPALLTLLNNGKSGVISADGILVYETNKAPNLPNITVTPQVQTDIGKNIMTKEEVDFVRLIENEFSETNNRSFRTPLISSYDLNIANNELVVRFKDTPYILRLNTQSEQREQIASVLALFQGMEQGTIAPPNEYIDARVPGRLFLR